jgi:hypothetical protein
MRGVAPLIAPAADDNDMPLRQKAPAAAWATPRQSAIDAFETCYSPSARDGVKTA